MIGKFITFEGGEGSGKTTQSKLLHQYFLEKKIDAIWTREIGGTEGAEKIRALIMGEDFADFAELLMILAARYEHMTTVILPALKTGKHVICDRFIDSSIAYSHLPMTKILELHNSIFGNFMPDITFFVDIDPEIGLNRAIERGDVNKFECKDLSFHQNVHKKFMTLTHKFPERIIRIDGSKTICAISFDILEQIRAYLPYLL